MPRTRSSIPVRRHGDYYSAVFSYPDRSVWHDVVEDAFKLTQTYRAPIPDFGTECVCCNTRTKLRFTLTTGTGAEDYSTPAVIPACRVCVAHVAYPRWRLWVSMSVAVLGGFTALVGIGMKLMAQPGVEPLIGIGLAIAALWFGAYQLHELWRRSSVRDGHHPWIGAHFAPNMFHVRTTNRALVERLSESPVFNRVQ